MQIEFDLNKSVDENAGIYFDLSKKAKKKLRGAIEALGRTRKELGLLREQEEKFLAEEEVKRQKQDRPRQWYEKFHWFMTSEGLLCIGGKDATSNEIVVKKHTDKDDWVLHTDMAGSPFFVIKNGQQGGEASLLEAAEAVAAYSRAWKLGHGTADVFYVKPEQVTKESKSGESVPRGAFMVYGDTKYLHPKLEYAIGLVDVHGEDDANDKKVVIDQQIIGGPLVAIESRTKNLVVVIPGKEKKSSLAKKIKGKLNGGELDDIIKFLPAGGGEIKKSR